MASREFFFVSGRVARARSLFRLVYLPAGRAVRLGPGDTAMLQQYCCCARNDKACFRIADNNFITRTTLELQLKNDQLFHCYYYY